jgi:hypothetical protein
MSSELGQDVARHARQQLIVAAAPVRRPLRRFIKATMIHDDTIEAGTIVLLRARLAA